MGCPDCEKIREAGDVYWYRWGVATVGIIACEKHFMEIRAKLQVGAH